MSVKRLEHFREWRSQFRILHCVFRPITGGRKFCFRSEIF